MPPSTCEGLCLRHELNPCVAHEGGLGWEQEEHEHVEHSSYEAAGIFAAYVGDVGRPPALGQDRRMAGVQGIPDFGCSFASGSKNTNPCHT